MAKAQARAARKTYSLVQAAAILEVHRNTLSKWIDQGCPVVTRGDRDRGIEWEISVADVVDWRMRKAVDDAVARFQGGAGVITRDEADRRTAVAKMIASEIEADESLSRVVAVADIAEIVKQEYGALRTQLQAAGPKIAGRAATMTSAPAIQELVDDVIADALGALQYDRRLAKAEPAQDG